MRPFLPDNLLSLLRGSLARRPAAEPAWHGDAALATDVAAPAPEPEVVRSPEELAALRRAEAANIWGEGFASPGHDEEVLRLVNPLALRPETTLLLVTDCVLGPARAIVGGLGCWISAYETDPLWLPPMHAQAERRTGVFKQVEMADWHSSTPRRAGFSAAAVLETRLDEIALLAKVAAALRPTAQCMVVALVAGAKTVKPSTMQRWASLERREGELATEQQVHAALRSHGFTVHVQEDITERQMRQGMLGWQERLGALRNAKPGRAEAGALIESAELWLLRMRMMEEGALRRVRWHASRTG